VQDKVGEVVDNAKASWDATKEQAGKAAADASEKDSASATTGATPAFEQS